jgi:type III pantothenate kinase
MMALASGAARLPEIKLKVPDSALGQNTIEAIQSGILFGYTGMVKEVLSRMKKELPSPCYVIATGGLVGLLPTLAPEFDEVDPFLTLKGLKIIADKVA